MILKANSNSSAQCFGRRSGIEGRCICFTTRHVWSVHGDRSMVWCWWGPGRGCSSGNNNYHTSRHWSTNR